MTANRPTTGTLAAHRQRLSGLLALFAAVLPLPSPGEELSQSPAPTEPGISIVFSALQREPDESFMEESSGWMLQFRSPEEYLSVGLEFISQPRIRHEFTYQVPYGTLHERRSYALHSFGMVLHLSPCPGCFLSPYVGYAAAAGFIKERMPDPRYFEGAGDYTHIWIGGPVVGLTLLPKARFSLFVEAREQSLLSGDLTRERTVSIDMLGNQVVAEDKVTLDARVALIGLRINF